MQYKNKDHFHGSDLEKIEELYGIPKENILSFSDNVNPLGISRELKESLSAHLDVITSYPDRDYTKLREAIGEYVGCSSGHDRNIGQLKHKIPKADRFRDFFVRIQFRFA